MVQEPSRCEARHLPGSGDACRTLMSGWTALATKCVVISQRGLPVGQMRGTMQLHRCGKDGNLITSSHNKGQSIDEQWVACSQIYHK